MGDGWVTDGHSVHVLCEKERDWKEGLETKNCLATGAKS